MEMNRFEQLVKQENGFEFCIGFRDEVDWIIGGKGNRFWFVIRKDGSNELPQGKPQPSTGRLPAAIATRLGYLSPASRS